MTAIPAIEVIDVRKAYGAHLVLRGVSLTVQPGETVVIAGRSGGGKSTLLRCLNRLEPIDGGEIRIGGEPLGVRLVDGRHVALRDREIARQRRALGMVFQSFNLFPHMTVMDNIIAAPVSVLKQPREAARTEATRLLALVGLPEKANAYPQHLSGGQQQRIAIARALAMKPRTMLFDEPTSALDPEMTREVLNVMGDLARQGMTMVVVTHEMGFARAAADRIVLMQDGQVAEDSPTAAFFERPTSEAGRAFLSRILT